VRNNINNDSIVRKFVLAAVLRHVAVCFGCALRAIAGSQHCAYIRITGPTEEIAQWCHGAR
jgi:hypothetical protein